VSAYPPLRTRRRPLWLGVLAVAIFGLRALIPTGYMLAAVDGHARLIVCPGGVHAAPATMSMEHGIDIGRGAMDAAAAMHHAGHAASGAEHCPYALSGGPGLVAASLESAEPYFSLLQPARAPAVLSVSRAPPPRYHAPRGPPSPA
jgi:hypothetical protein